MNVSKQKVENAYQRNAKLYDLAVKIIYPLIGLKIGQYRKKAVDILDLKEGDFVIDLGCGTGLCFPLLVDKIGPNGRLVGVDISSEMLSVAEERVKSFGWNNVELIKSDIDRFEFPYELNALISTGVFGYLEHRKEILEKIYLSLVDRGKVVIVDGKYPQKWPSFLYTIFVKLCAPFGVTKSYFENNTPELVAKIFHDVTFEDVYGGLIYITSGEKYEEAA